MQAGLVNYIHNLRTRSELVSVPKNIAATPEQQKVNDPSWQDRVLKECEEFLRDYRRLRDLETLKAKGKTRTGRINPLASTKSALKGKKGKSCQDYSKTEGIEEAEISRRKVAAECLHCAWPSDRKGTHTVKDCIRAIKLDKETAEFPLAKKYQQKMQPLTSSEGSESSEE